MDKQNLTQNFTQNFSVQKPLVEAKDEEMEVTVYEAPRQKALSETAEVDKLTVAIDKSFRDGLSDTPDNEHRFLGPHIKLLDSEGALRACQVLKQ